MLIATHEMGFARDIANRVCFLDAGVILEEGPPEEIFGAPRSRARSSSSSESSTPDGSRIRRQIVIEDPQRIDLTLEPLDDFVVIQPTDDEAETQTGLIIPASAEARLPDRDRHRGRRRGRAA